MSSRVVKKNGRLIIKAHKDCFLHVSTSWLNYWPVSLSSENLMLVRVTLPDTYQFLTTIFPKPLPTATFRPSPRNVEIDTYFAKQLGIYASGTEVLVEVVRDIERCTELYLEPESPEELDKLETNYGRIEYELLSRIRVVSAQSFSFPIWIENDVIPVRVVSSEPAAKWVLLGSEETGVRGERATAIRFRRPYDISPSTSSTDSYISPSDIATDVANSSLGFKTWRQGLRSSVGSDSDNFSPPEVDNVSIASSAGSKLFDIYDRFMRPVFSAINSQGVIQSDSGTDRIGTRTPEPAISQSPPNTVSKFKTQPTHRKTKSCSQLLDPTTPNTTNINTPAMNTLLRVQPHSIGGPDGISKGNHEGGDSGPRWGYSRVFDVYVHPSTFPEISNYYHSSEELGSFLVRVKPSNVPRNKTVSQSQGNQDNIRPPQPAPSDLSGVPETASSVSDSRLEFSRIVSVFAGLSSSFRDSQSDISDGGSSVKSDKPQSLVFASSLVLRLCFATKLVMCRDNRVRPFPYSIPANNPKEFVECEEVLKVVPGHIVMSHLVQRQLRIGTCSTVSVCHVGEDGKLPTTHGQVTVHVRTLDEKASLMSVHRQNLEEGMRSWVQQVGKDNPFGAVLVTNQIIPLFDQGNCHYCSLELPASHLKLSPSQRQPSPYLLAMPLDIVPSNRPERVKIVVERSQWVLGSTVTLPPLEELDPTPIKLNPRHFGAFDELLERGRVFVRSAMQHGRSLKPRGRLLISGSAGNAGLSCGKTSLAQLIAQQFTDYPTYAHVQLIDCTTLRAQAVARVGKRLHEIFDTAVECQPSVVVLDNLQHAMPHFSDVEESATGEGFVGMRNAQALLDQLSRLDQTAVQVVVIATTTCRQDLHPMLLQSRGCHVFEEVLEIRPPDQAGRQSILSAVMASRDVYMDTDLIRHVVGRTEGYQVGDLTGVVDRAISCAHIRHTCPDLHVPHDAVWTSVKKCRSQVSFTFDETGESTSALMTRSLPSSPLKEHRRVKYTKSFSPTLKQRLLGSLTSMEPTTHPSTLTLVDQTQSRLETDADGRLRLTARDVRAALKDFVPLTLRGLSLCSSGMVDFSKVGGMKETKKVLRETILWPSRYPQLFQQCPIKMCRGILLYGPPGTGKTILAGSIAKQFGLNFISIKGPEILSKYIGASEQAVRDLFARAQAAKPCVLFFDEFESLAPKRGQDRTGVTDRVVNQLLTQLDGVETLEGVYLVAATSRPDMIDPALLRPGRIDKSIFCDHPDKEERLDILKVLSKGLSLQGTVDLRRIADSTTHYTGADLKAVLYSAQLRAAHRVLDKEKQEVGVASSSVMTSSDVRSASEETGVGQRSNASSNVVVYKLTSAARCTEVAVQPDLCQRAVTLLEISRDKVKNETLRENTNLQGDSEGKRGVCITQDDLTVALEDVKPSVSHAERQKYTDIYERFTGKIQQTLKSVINQRATMA